MNKVKRKPKHPRPEAKVPSAPCSLNKSLHEQAGLASVWKNANHRTDEREIAPAEDGETIEITTMADLAEVVSEVKFLLREWIPFGMITGIVAEPGVGKSAFAMWLARCVMTGQPWFTGRKGPQPSQVLWCATENDMANTLGRMSQWKIPKHKLLLPFKDPLATINLSDPKHLKRMEQIIRQEQIKLVGVFDPQAIPASRGGHWP